MSSGGDVSRCGCPHGYTNRPLLSSPGGLKFFGWQYEQAGGASGTYGCNYCREDFVRESLNASLPCERCPKGMIRPRANSDTAGCICGTGYVGSNCTGCDTANGFTSDRAKFGAV